MIFCRKENDEKCRYSPGYLLFTKGQTKSQIENIVFNRTETIKSAVVPNLFEHQ